MCSELSSVGFTVLRNVFILGFEIDVIALDTPPRGRPVVYVVEVKRRVKSKLIKQLRKRAPYADYVYAAVPHALARQALRRIPTPFGVLLVDPGSVVRIVVARRATYLGRGEGILNALSRSYSVSIKGLEPRHSAAVKTSTPRL